MEIMNTLNEFSQAEKELLIGYVMAYLWDVSSDIQIVEHKAAPNILLHYAVSTNSDKLTGKNLDSLPTGALERRDAFNGILSRLNIPIQTAAIAVQFLADKAVLGVIDRSVRPWSIIKQSDERVELDFYLKSIDGLYPQNFNWN